MTNSENSCTLEVAISFILHLSDIKICRNYGPSDWIVGTNKI